MPHREIILIWERDVSKRAHAGIEASIRLFQCEADPALAFRWVTTADIAANTSEQLLDSATGIWCVPGSPYKSTEGALQAIRYAREHHLPLLPWLERQHPEIGAARYRVLAGLS